MNDLDIGRRSNVLLDANILIDFAKEPKSFGGFLSALSNKDVVGVLERIVEFEYLRGVADEDDKKARKLLETLCGSSPLVLQPDADIFKEALKIARIYHRAGVRGVDVPDILTAAQAARYARDTQKSEYELLIATQNHKHFPAVLFDCVATACVEMKNGTIRPIGFYRFNKQRFQELCN